MDFLFAVDFHFRNEHIFPQTVTFFLSRNVNASFLHWIGTGDNKWFTYITKNKNDSVNKKEKKKKTCKTSGNTKTPSTEVLVLSLAEYEHGRPLKSIATWNNHYCRLLLTAPLSGKQCNTSKESCFGKQKRCYCTVWHCRGTFGKRN